MKIFHSVRPVTLTRMAVSVLSSLLVLSVFWVAGCTKKPEASITTIRFVTWKPNQPEMWDEIIKNFEKEYPTIKVEREIGPHSSTAFHDLLTQKLKNRSKDADVFFMDVIWPPEFASAGWAMPLDDLFSSAEREKFLQGPMAADTYRGKIYGIPLFIDTGMFYYRKDLLEKYGFQPPRTWPDMVDQAQKIVTGERKKGTEIAGYSGQFKQYEGLVCNMMEFILNNGGHIINPETGKSSLAEKPAVEAVRFVRDKIVGHIAPEGVLTYQEPESLDLFVQGNAVFHRNWPYAWEVSNNPQKSKIAGKVGVTTLPAFPGGESHAALGGWQLGISSFSEKKEAAWKFIQFVSGDAIQKLIAVKAGKAPTRIAVYNDPDVLKVSPQFADMKKVFMTAYPRPRTPLYPAVSNVMQRYFSKAISDPTSDIQGEARTASEEINKLIEMAK